MEKKILIGVDGGDKARQSLTTLGQLVRDVPDVRLVLFHGVRPLASLLPEELLARYDEENPSSQARETAANRLLSEARSRLADLGVSENRIETKFKMDSIDPARDLLVESDKLGIRTVALGRHGTGQVRGFLMGSVANKVAQYARQKTVWVTDTQMNETGDVLISVQEVPDSYKVVEYAADFLAPNPNLSFTFLHVMPPLPPTFWDDGHILNEEERKERRNRVAKWKQDWTGQVEEMVARAFDLFKSRGVGEERLKSWILPRREGLAQDLLAEIKEHDFSVVVMGRNAREERKSHLIGAHAGKVLQAVKGAAVCLVDL